MSPRSPNPERSFGVSVGTVVAAISAYLLWRGPIHAAAPLGIVGVVLLALAFGRPTLLEWPSALWWRFSRTLAHVNARVLLTILFVVILVPMGVVCRATRLDPLQRRRSRWSGWIEHPRRYRNRAHYSRMY